MSIPLHKVKIAVGLALESAIIHNIETHDLESLYAEPSTELVRELHDRLIDSESHRDRVAAFWLQMGFDQGQIQNDPRALIADMTKMEVLLGVFINQAGDAWKDVNDWMNYIANSHEHLTNGYWTDAKVLLSLGFEISRRPSIEELKTKESLRKKVTLFQQATDSYFDEMKYYPLELHVPEEYIDATMSLQELLIDIMKNHESSSKEEGECVGSLIEYMSSALRKLMSSMLDKVKKELTTSRNSLTKWKTLEKGKASQIEGYIQRLDKIVAGL